LDETLQVAPGQTERLPPWHAHCPSTSEQISYREYFLRKKVCSQRLCSVGGSSLPRAGERADGREGGAGELSVWERSQCASLRSPRSMRALPRNCTAAQNASSRT